MCACMPMLIRNVTKWNENNTVIRYFKEYHIFSRFFNKRKERKNLSESSDNRLKKKIKGIID